jgi:hypothetical protein
MPACLHLRASCSLRACERHLVRANLHQVGSLFVRVTLLHLTPFDTGVSGFLLCAYPDRAAVSQSQLMRSLH